MTASSPGPGSTERDPDPLPHATAWLGTMVLSDLIKKWLGAGGWLIPTLAVVVPALVLAVGPRLPVVQEIESVLLDLRFQARAPKPPSEEIMLLLIDERSIREIGRWPWSRGTMAEVVETVAAAEPLSIGIDLLFAEPEPAAVPAAWLGTLGDALRAQEERGSALNTEAVVQVLRRLLATAPGDRDLGAAIDAAGHVVLPVSLGFDPAGDDIIEHGEPLQVNAYPQDALPRSRVQATTVLPPIPELATPSAGLGHANAGLDASGAARYEYLVIEVDGLAIPSLALELARVSLGLERSEARFVPGLGLRIGEVALPADSALRMLVNYAAPGRFRKASVVDLLEGRIGPEFLRNRIVLIGGSAAGLGGALASPFTSEMTGIERHAAALDTMLNRDFLVAGGIAHPLTVILLCFGGFVVWLASRVSTLLVTGVVFIAVAATLTAANVLAFTVGGLVLDLFVPLAALTILFLIVSSHAYVTGVRAERQLRRAFRHYLNPEIVDRVAKDPELLQLGGEERHLTVLFADLRNSVEIASNLGPTAFVEFLNDVFHALGHVVFEHGGMLDKFLGDGVVVVFGAPIHRPDHAESACRTALGMLEAIEPVRARWVRPGLPRIDLGIGINTGPMIIGNLGSRERFDYTVIGDEASLGARLEAANKDLGTCILMSAATAAEVQGRIAMRELDVIRFRGVKMPITVFEVVGAEPIAETRARELEVFRSGLEAFRAGELGRAHTYFEAVLKTHPDDQPTRLYLERIANQHRLMSQPQTDLGAGAF